MLGPLRAANELVGHYGTAQTIIGLGAAGMAMLSWIYGIPLPFAINLVLGTIVIGYIGLHRYALWRFQRSANAPPTVRITDLVPCTISQLETKIHKEQYWCLLVESIDPDEQLDGCLATIEQGTDEAGRTKLSLARLGTERQFAENRPRGRFKLDPGQKKRVVLFKHRNIAIATYTIWTVDGKGHRFASANDECSRVDVMVSAPRGSPAKATVYFGSHSFWLEVDGQVVREIETKSQQEA